MSAAIRVIPFYGLVNCTSDGEDREGAGVSNGCYAMVGRAQRARSAVRRAFGRLPPCSAHAVPPGATS